MKYKTHYVIPSQFVSPSHIHLTKAICGRMLGSMRGLYTNSYLTLAYTKNKRKVTCKKCKQKISTQQLSETSPATLQPTNK